jgi:hypothetical protein
MFLWMFYFDNHPRHHYGTIRQQFWAGLYFPLHIGIIGVLEGSQQIAIALYIFKTFMKLEKDIHSFCVVQNLDGIALRESIISAIKSLKLEDKLESKASGPSIPRSLAVTNITGICSVANTQNLPPLSSFPADFNEIMIDVFGALFQSTGIKLPSRIDPAQLAKSTFLTVYIYYWASICLTVICFAVFFWLTQHKDRRAKVFERIAIGSRAVVAVFAIGMGAAVASNSFLYHYIRSPAILPTVAAALFLVLCGDRWGGDERRGGSRGMWGRVWW